RGIILQDNKNLSWVSYLIFDSLILDAGGSSSSIAATNNCFFAGANTHHIRIQNSELRNCNQAIIFTTETTSYIEIKNNRIHNAYVSLFDGAHPTTGNYGMYVKFHNSLIEGNTIYNNTGYGIHLYGSGLKSVSNNVIRGNIVYGNGFSDGERALVLGGLIVASGGNNLAYN